ncbi:MAG: sugar ABC transporter permease [Clostridia bacterium]|nr:sugar ABC transporter permease [Clostridia bacterium]
MGGIIIAGKVKASRLNNDNRQGWLSILPVLVLELVIFAYPIGVVLVKSFTNWDGLFKNDFVGLRNYVRLLSDKNFLRIVKNTGIFLLTIPVQALIGMMLAVILYDQIRGWKFFRLVYYLPSIISMVTVGFLFKVLFSYAGPLNDMLRAVGLDALAIEWLGDGGSARFIVFLCLVWSNLGWQILIIFGGLSNISPDIFEAARIDGAGYWRRLFSITIPMLIRTIEYSFISAMLWIFTGIFPLIHAITSGGPGYETTTLDYMVYVKGFNGSKLGQASALSVMLLLIILIITVIQMTVSNKLDDWER